jgi:hypothetical protein
MGKGKRSGGRKGGGSRGAYGMNPTSRSDLAVRPPDQRRVPKGVPRSVQNLVTWDVVKFQQVINTSTTAIVETNFQFSLSQHPQTASWTALFDQWTIPQASVSFECQTPPGATGYVPILFTSLDFDNANNIASLASIQDYSTCMSRPMEPNAVVLRSVRPCCKSTISGAGSTGCERLWLDCGTNSNPWYAIRSITTIASQAVVINAEVTIWFAFRNQI